MGERIAPEDVSDDVRPAARERLEQSVHVLAAMLDEGRLSRHEDTLGAEVELNLVDPLGRPRPVNDEMLRRLDRADLQQELAAFNLEFNLAPRAASGPALSSIAADIHALLRQAHHIAEEVGARIVPVGILPTLTDVHLTREYLSSNPRYAVLADALAAARGEPFRLDLAGRENVRVLADSVAPEAAATSLQFHLRVPADRFAAYFDAAHAVAAAQVAVGANSPFLLGRDLWAETRIGLCEQALDTRTPEMVRQGVRNRVWFGSGWGVDGPGVFAENVRWFSPLIPRVDDEDPAAALAAGATPALHELRLHSGTVWRWNRPVYDPGPGGTDPHLRVENRVLPAGPTPADMAANGALWFGVVRALADTVEPGSGGHGRRGTSPAWRREPFDEVERSLTQAARFGLDAKVAWAGEPVDVRRLLLDVLLPAAARGLAALGVAADEADHYLGIVERRAVTGRTGAWWQRAQVAAAEARGLDRPSALREMVRQYVEHVDGGEPVHRWDVG